MVNALRSRTGKRGVSAYITEAVRHEMAMDGLAEIVAAHEGAHGALSEEEVQSAQEDLFGDRGVSGAAEGAA